MEREREREIEKYREREEKKRVIQNYGDYNRQK